MTYATALIGADADPEVGHHNGETDHHDKDQLILGSVTPPAAGHADMEAGSGLKCRSCP